METTNVIEVGADQIVLKNSDLNNFTFQQTFNKLKTMPFGTKTAYKISYIGNHIDKYVKQGREVFQTIAKKFAQLDEKGNLVPETQERTNPETGEAEQFPIPGSFLFKDDESKEAFMKEQEEFMNIEHVIPKHKLSVDELGDSKLSANDISALEPLFSDLD